MPSTVKLNGKSFNKGDTVTFNENAAGICYGPKGLTVFIHYLQGDSKNPNIGLYSPDKRIGEWSDLDGEVGDHRGWWISARELEKCILDLNAKYTISKPIDHCGIQLKDKPCQILAHLDNGLVFVEFEEDVCGCSADGLGKSGYCVAVKPNIIVRENKREKHAK